MDFSSRNDVGSVRKCNMDSGQFPLEAEILIRKRKKTGHCLFIPNIRIIELN